jgi:hypothetical protein
VVQWQAPEHVHDLNQHGGPFPLQMPLSCSSCCVQVDESTSTVMLDTSGGAWITPTPGTLSGEDVTRRCRHAVTSVGPFVFIYGGLKGSTLLDDLLLAGEA